MTRQAAKQGLGLHGLRNTNVTALLAAVWNHGPVSRIELARLTGLAPSSITRLARRLEEAGVIRETSKGRSSGGRQPSLLALAEDAGLVVGIDLSGVDLRARVMNALGTPVAVTEQPFRGCGPDAIERQLVDVAAVLLRQPAVAARRVLGIGVSVPGSVETATGLVVEATNLALHDFPLGPRLHERFGLPVYVEHDTISAALAEKHYGAGRGASNLIYITVSTGVGTGLIVGDQVYRGEHGLAGELGHITVERHGPLCLCGKRGCLETVASAPAMVASARRMLDQGSDSLIARGAMENGGLTIDTIARAAEQGDRIATEIVGSAADYLAMAIGTLVSILDISMVIVGGEVAQVGALFFDLLRRALQKYQLDGMVANVLPAQLGQDAALKGVSMVTLQQVLSLVD